MGGVPSAVASNNPNTTHRAEELIELHKVFGDLTSILAHGLTPLESVQVF